jgi:deoxyribonuclease-4
MGAGFETQLPQIAQAFVRALDEADPAPDGVAERPILMENTAGHGRTVGPTLEDIAAMIDACGGDERLGLCIDTQHLWASGVDFSTIEGANALVAEIDDRIGLDRLRCFHLNDSKTPLGGNKDRHANIDEGEIGQRGLAALMGHPAMRDLPMILEVPGDGEGPRASDVLDAEATWTLGVSLYDTTTAKKK